MFGLGNCRIGLGVIPIILEPLAFFVMLTRSMHNLRHLGHILSLNMHLRSSNDYFGINDDMA